MAGDSRYVLFEVGRSNLGRTDRVTMAALCAKWNRLLTAIDLSVPAFYAHTGNFVLTSRRRTPPAELSDLLFKLVGRRFAVFSDEDFLEWLPRLTAALERPPQTEPDRRPTPGAVMNLDPEAGIPGTISAAEHLTMSPFAIPRVRGVWKHDALRADRRALDRNHRDGGWGAVTQTFADTLGGDWTARALSTLKGVANRLAESALRDS